MMNSPLPDLGLSLAAIGLPGAPPVVATGVAAPDFASALAQLLTGAAPVALTSGGSVNRQAVAATGKDMPGETPRARIVADLPVCELLAPELPSGPILSHQAGDAESGKDGEQVELGEPELEPSLAWLMPPLPAPTPAGTIVLPITNVLNTPTSPIDAEPGQPCDLPPSAPVAPSAAEAIAVPQTPSPVLAAPSREAVIAATPAGVRDTVAPSVTDARSPATPPRPADAKGVFDRVTTEQPSYRATQSAAPIVPPATAEVQRPIAAANPARPLPLPIAADDPDVVAAPAIRPAAPAEGGPVVPRRQRSIVAPIGQTTAPEPAVPARQPLAAIPETQLRATATQRVEIQPVVPPVQDSGVMLAAAAALRTAPALASHLTDQPAGFATLPPTDVSLLAPIAAGAPAAAPVGAPQQAGIDLTRDPGLHQMIDRIEQLRDAFDARDTRIRLIPDTLGPVDIAVRRDAASDAVQVHFTAVEAGTRQLIADTQQRLLDLAESRGVRIERATVDGTNQSWSGDGQSRPQQQAQLSQPRAPASAFARDERDTESPFTEDRIA